MPRDAGNIGNAWRTNMAFRMYDLIQVGNLLESSGYHKAVAENLELSLRIRFQTSKRIIFNKEAYVWQSPCLQTKP